MSVLKTESLNSTPLDTPAFDHPAKKEEWKCTIDKQIPSEVPSNTLIGALYFTSSVCTLGIVPLIRHQLAKLVSSLILPSLMSSTHEMKEANRQIKLAFQAYYSERFKEFDLHINETAALNGMTLFLNGSEREAFEQKKAAEQKWIIYFNGNGAFYECALEQSLKLAEESQANILVFNYRGVGASRGEVSQPEDLIQDGEACIQYLLSKGVREESILIYGHSLGGGVGTQVARIHEKIGLVNDRSFASLSAAIHGITKSRFLANLAVSLGWELDSVQAFEKMANKKWIVWHKKDDVIPYHESSLYYALKEKIKALNPSFIKESVHKGKPKQRLQAEYKPQGAKLQRKIARLGIGEAHNYRVYTDKTFFKTKAFIRNFFQLEN